MISSSTQLMLVINVTPDSFSDGGRFGQVDDVLRQVEEGMKQGVGIFDIGGESTRPGAQTVSVDEELMRVLPVVNAIKSSFPEAIISVDTRKSGVAQLVLDAGADIINDVSGLQFDAAMAETIAAYPQTRLVLMHSQGKPETMQDNPIYDDVVVNVKAFFEKQINVAVDAGISRENIILDPGFGFGKTVAHNLALLGDLKEFKSFGLPILAGTSRKSFLTLGHNDVLPSERDALTAASLAIAVQNGADILRIHNLDTLGPVVRFLNALLAV